MSDFHSMVHDKWLEKLNNKPGSQKRFTSDNVVKTLFVHAIEERLDHYSFRWVKNFRTILARKLAGLECLRSKKWGNLLNDYYTMLLYHADQYPPLDETSLAGLIRLASSLIPDCFNPDDHLTGDEEDYAKLIQIWRLKFWITEDEAEKTYNHLNDPEPDEMPNQADISERFWVKNEIPKKFYKLILSRDEWSGMVVNRYGDESLDIFDPKSHWLKMALYRPAGRVSDYMDTGYDKPNKDVLTHEKFRSVATR